MFPAEELWRRAFGQDDGVYTVAEEAEVFGVFLVGFEPVLGCGGGWRGQCLVRHCFSDRKSC